MFRFLARTLGLLLIAAGFVGLVIDGTRSIASGVMFTPLGEVAYRMFGERYLLLQPAIERHVHPALWDPVVLNLTLLPASVVGFLLGVLLLWLGQKRPEPIGFCDRPLSRRVPHSPERPCVPTLRAPHRFDHGLCALPVQARRT